MRIPAIPSPREVPYLVGTLGLGVGAACAAWMLLEAAILRPLPFSAPEALVRVWTEDGPAGRTITDRDLRAWRAADNPPVRLAAFTPMGAAGIEREGLPSLTGVSGLLVSGEFFDVLGVVPFRGRKLGRADELTTSDAVVVVSERLPGLTASDYGVGSELKIDGIRYRVVGVMPSSFVFPDPSALFWLPRLDVPTTAGSTAYIRAIGRLQGDASRETAAAWLDDWGDDASGLRSSARVVDLREDVSRAARVPLLVAQTLAGLVLAMACLNAAWVFGWRYERLRDRQLTLSSLGATPARLARDLLIEVGCIAGLSVAVAVPLAWCLLRTVLHLANDDLPRAWESGLTLSAVVVAAVAAAVGACLSAAPAGLLTIRIAAGTHKPAAGQGRRGLGASSLLVVQVAVVFALGTQAATAALVLRDMVGPRVGLDHRDLSITRFSLTGEDRADAELLAARVNALLGSLQRVGVRAAVTNAAPLTSYHRGLNIRSFPPTDDYLMAGLRLVSPSYGDVTGLRLIAGRHLTPADAGTQAIVVNDVLAQAMFGSPRVAVGGLLTIGAMRNPSSAIVGVVVGIRHMSLTAEPDPEVYLLQANAGYLPPGGPDLFLVSTTAATPDADIQGTIREQFPAAEVRETWLLKTLLWRYAGAAPLAALTAGCFAVIAIGLLMLGIQGFVSANMRRRRQELAVRLAVGATRARVAREHAQGIVVPCGIGIAAGWVLSTWLSRAVSAALLEHSDIPAPSLMLTGTLAALVVLGLTLLAALRPLYRGTRIDIRALLQE